MKLDRSNLMDKSRRLFGVDSLMQERDEARQLAELYRLKVVALGNTKGWTPPQPLPWDKDGVPTPSP